MRKDRGLQAAQDGEVLLRTEERRTGGDARPFFVISGLEVWYNREEHGLWMEGME